ncbi:MAG: hypothetical protein VYA11_02205 [Planctomycetota bacterium]|nr:hypothetical protein [Planctomycetota bacterium]
MKLAVLFAQDDGETFFSGPTFFLGLVIICFLLMFVTAVRDWWLKRKQNQTSLAESDSVVEDSEEDSNNASLTKAEKKQAALEAKQIKKEAKEAKKREKAAAKAEAKAAKAAKKAKRKKK